MNFSEFCKIVGELDFPIMILFGNFLLSLHYPKRKYWYAFIPLVVIPILICYFFKPSDELVGCIKFLLIFLSSFLPLVLFVKANFWTYLYVGTLSYSFQHSIQRTAILFSSLISGVSSSYPLRLLFEVMVSIIFYVLAYLLFVHKTEKDKLPIFDNKIQIVIASFVLLVTIFLSLISIVKSSKLEDKSLFYVTTCFSVLSCFAAIALELSQSKLKETQIDNQFLHILLHESKMQYEASKKSIEQINIKCHDLKHLLNNIHTKISQEETIELKKQIDIYDHSFDTGNKALDTILTQKAVECSQNDIRFTCLLDGRTLSFMKEQEIYFLFENALSNAIKETMALDEEHKVISIVEESDGLTNKIVIKNYFSGDVRFNENQIPISKSKSIYHGYGTKSMIYIVKKHDGEILFETDKNIFTLSIFFPKTACDSN